MQTEETTLLNTSDGSSDASYMKKYKWEKLL